MAAAPAAAAPAAKRARPPRSLALSAPELEARPAPEAGHGVFALVDVPSGWLWKDRPVCVPRRAGEEGTAERRLPRADDIDELMQELCERAQAGDEASSRLLSGEWAMSYMQRHLEMQGDGPDEMPQWALACGTSASQYNLLAAQLQSNVARHAEGGGFVLNPQLRLVNHACGDAANAELAEIAYAEEITYAARTRRPISAGEQMTYSCAPQHAPNHLDLVLDRRSPGAVPLPLPTPTLLSTRRQTLAMS